MYLNKLYTRRTVSHFLWILFFMFFLSSCFTGVESTPKINNAEVKHQNAGNITPEQVYLKSVSPSPLEFWEVGKEFIVTDDKIGVIFTQSSQPSSLGKGDIMEFREAVETLSPVGAATDLYFSNPTDNATLIYRINSSLQELRRRDEVDIPFTVEKAIVDSAGKIMKGKEFYILTPRWNDDKGNLITRVKFIPVTVVDVTVGNHDLPLRVIFRPNYKGMDETTLYNIFMTVGNSARSSRNFETLFALENPRKRYSNVTDENWESIIAGRLKKGMTRDEARLTLGSPVDVDRGHDYSSVYERWLYDGGIYLIFRDGILEQFRQ